MPQGSQQEGCRQGSYQLCIWAFLQSWHVRLEPKSTAEQCTTARAGGLEQIAESPAQLPWYQLCTGAALPVWLRCCCAEGKFQIIPSVWFSAFLVFPDFWMQLAGTGVLVAVICSMVGCVLCARCLLSFPEQAAITALV